MSLRIGNTEPTKLYLGSEQVSKIYLGSNQVWPSTPVVVGDVSFGQYTRVGAGAVSVGEADGTYGQFTVSGGSLSGNTTPLTVGDHTVGSITVTVLANTIHVTGTNPDAKNSSELNTVMIDPALHPGKTIVLRPGSHSGWIGLKRFSTYTGAPTTIIKSEDADNKGSIQATYIADHTGELHLVFEDVHFFPSDYSVYNTFDPDERKFHMFDIGKGDPDSSVEFQRCIWNAWYVPEDWDEYDHRAKFVLNNFSGGSPVAGQGLEVGSGGHNDPSHGRVEIWEVQNDGGGQYTVWVSDNISAGGDFQNTASRFSDSDSVTVYTSREFDATTGITCTVQTADSDPTGSSNSAPTLGTQVLKNCFINGAYGKCTFNENVFSGVARPLAGGGELVCTNNLFERYRNDAIQWGYLAAEQNTPRKLTIKNNVAHRNDVAGEFRSNPHSDFLQTEQNANGPWEVDIQKNMFFKGSGYADSQGLFCGQNVQNGYFHGLVANNIMQMAGHNIEFNPARNLTVVNNIALQTTGVQESVSAFMYINVSNIPGADNIIANNITHVAWIGDVNGIDVNNLLVAPADMADWFDNSNDFNYVAKTVPEMLQRFTPKDTWEIGNYGCIDHNSNWVDYDPASVPVVPATMSGSHWSAAIGSAGGSIAITITAAPTSHISSPVTDYEYTTDSGTTWKSLGLATTGTVNVITESDSTELVSGANHSINVRAVAAIGPGLISSNTESATVANSSAPSAMVSGDWTVTKGANGSELVFEIVALPLSGGSAITSFEYSTDDGSTWATLGGGVGTGIRYINTHSDGATGLLTENNFYDTMLRAVNASGNASDSDSKNVQAGLSPVNIIPAAVAAMTTPAAWTYDAAVTSFGVGGMTINNQEGAARNIYQSNAVQYRIPVADDAASYTFTYTLTGASNFNARPSIECSNASGVWIGYPSMTDSGFQDKPDGTGSYTHTISSLPSGTVYFRISWDFADGAQAVINNMVITQI